MRGNSINTVRLGRVASKSHVTAVYYHTKEGVAAEKSYASKESSQPDSVSAQAMCLGCISLRAMTQVEAGTFPRCISPLLL